MPLGLVLRWVSRLRSTRTELSVETGLARLLPELRDPAALARRNERLADLPEAGHRLLPRMGIGAAHRIAPRRESLAFGRAAGVGQPQLLGAPVAVSRPRRQYFARSAVLHHTTHGPFG